VGITVVLILERQRRPQLSMTIGEAGRILPNDPLDRPETKWLHVDIGNTRIPKWIGWAYDRLPAPQCRAWITFHHVDGHRVFPREMVARWVETPQPSPKIIPTDKGQAATLHNQQHVVDIPPGAQSSIDISSKCKGDEACYGWNNESYLHDWKHPEWKFGSDRYIVRVRVRTSGREFTDAFLLVNDAGYDGFRLEPLEPERRAKLEEVLAMETAAEKGQ
jgi:hypothetical protein